MSFDSLGTRKLIENRKCLGVVNVNVPISPSNHDYNVAKTCAQIQAAEDYGKITQLVLISETYAQLIFVVF